MTGIYLTCKYLELSLCGLSFSAEDQCSWIQCIVDLWMIRRPCFLHLQSGKRKNIFYLLEIKILSGTWSSGRDTTVDGTQEWDPRTQFIIVTHNSWVWKINSNPKLIVWPKSWQIRRSRTTPCLETEDLVDLDQVWCQVEWSLSIYNTVRL